MRSLLAFLCLALTHAPLCAAEVPAHGARVLIAFDRHGEIAGRTEGVADPVTGRAPTLDDPVRVASVSKLVVALGVMRLVDEGRLDLDRPIGDWLGYPVVNPAFPDRPVTLRHLLGHTSSLRDHDDRYVIGLGGTIRAVLADRDNWDPAHAPGSGHFAYANLNFPVVASVMEAATGERFDLLMRRLLFDPLGIDACFNWPTCSDAAVARAVVLAAPDGTAIRDQLGGRRPDCPVVPAQDGGCDLSRWRPGENGSLFSPQGGLRISANGLARIGRMLLGGGRIDGRRILSRLAVRTLLSPTWRAHGQNGDREDGFYCRFGLSTHHLATPAPACRDDPTGAGRSWIGHAGEAYGLRSGLWIDRKRRVGIAYYVTALGDSPAPGRSAFAAAEEAAFRDSVALLPQRR